MTCPVPNKIPLPSAPGHRVSAATNPANTSSTGPTSPNNTPGYAQPANPAITPETLPHLTGRDRSKPQTACIRPKPPISATAHRRWTPKAAATSPTPSTHHRSGPAAPSPIAPNCRWPAPRATTGQDRTPNTADNRPEHSSRPNQISKGEKTRTSQNREPKTGTSPIEPFQKGPLKAPASRQRRVESGPHACTSSAALER